MRLRDTTPVFLVSDIAATLQWYEAHFGFSGRAVPDRPAAGRRRASRRDGGAPSNAGLH